MDAAIRDKCRNVFCQAIEILEPERIDWSKEVSPETVAEWDSLSHVKLLAALEKEFEIAVTPEEGLDLETFDAVCRLVSRKTTKS